MSGLEVAIAQAAFPIERRKKQGFNKGRTQSANTHDGLVINARYCKSVILMKHG